MAKILLVDDDPEFLEMLRLLLGREGEHDIILAADGEDGLAQALADPPDLILLDVMMPGITGYEICHKLRANLPTAHVPIIILTARGQPVDRQAALDAGADDYMSKPISMEDLEERVTRLLAKRGQLLPLSGTIALLSLRGGVGVTTLAVNLAAAIAQTDGGSTCLVDYCASSGHVALQLGMRPDPNWSKLVQAGGFDAATLEANLITHPTGLHILASPLFPTPDTALPRQIAQGTLKLLQQRFAFTIIDTPSVMNGAALAAIESATVVGLVVTAESPSLQTAIGTLGALKKWARKIHIILNHVTPGPQTPTAALERTLKRPLLGNIAFDPAQAQALAQGTPLALTAAKSPLAQGVHNLAQALASLPSSAGQPA